MLQKIFYNSFNISKFTRICMENHSSMNGWQKLFFPYKFFYFSAAIAIAAFKIYSWKFTGYLILICSFSSCWKNFSKVNCFRVYRKLIMWSTKAKGLFYWFLPQVTKLTDGKCGGECFVTCVVAQKIIITIIFCATTIVIQ